MRVDRKRAALLVVVVASAMIGCSKSEPAPAEVKKDPPPAPGQGAYMPPGVKAMIQKGQAGNGN